MIDESIAVTSLKFSGIKLPLNLIHSNFYFSVKPPENLEVQFFGNNQISVNFTHIAERYQSLLLKYRDAKQPNFAGSTLLISAALGKTQLISLPANVINSISLQYATSSPDVFTLAASVFAIVNSTTLSE